MNALAVFAIAGLALAALAFFNGIASMAHGGPEDQRDSHRLMFQRVGWQALAALIVMLGLLGQLA